MLSTFESLQLRVPYRVHSNERVLPWTTLSSTETSLVNCANKVVLIVRRRYIQISLLHVYHGSISRYGRFMLLALAGGRIVFNDRVVIRMVRAGAPSSRVGVTREALGRTLSVLVAG